TQPELPEEEPQPEEIDFQPAETISPTPITSPASQNAEEISEPSEPEPQQPRVILPKKKPSPPQEPKPVEKMVAKQEILQFESVTRGRFEKSEPTIVEGQDLDVPTFLRKNVRVK
ncbi:MAG: hypothetical protein H0W04_03130, partial [Chthoniobacterales bacterium]|nr:hypothetical protein [Chthoniobacterales bacterium]